MQSYHSLNADGIRELPKNMIAFYCLAGFITIIVIINTMFMSNSSYGANVRRAAKQLVMEEVSQIDANLINDLNRHEEITKEFYSRRVGLLLSKLGEILFLNAPLPPKKKKTFNILVWNDGPQLDKRHLSHDPFKDCSVNNCLITHKSENLTMADAVIFLVDKLHGFSVLPDPLKPRPIGQRWIFLNDESPHGTFLSENRNWEKYSGVFNWSMSYKMESDIPVPYGRTVPFLSGAMLGESNTNERIISLIPYNEEKGRDVLVAMITSKCEDSPMMKYVYELQKFLNVDIYGACGDNLKTACSGYLGVDCPKLNSYLFYLSFENSDCNEYVTEKVFWNGYSKGSIPIIMTPSHDTCNLLLPPESYLHVSDFARPGDLARYILHVNQTWNENFFNLHKWRIDFEVINEHGYFGKKSYHYCRVCEALNYNDDSPSVHDEVDFYLNPNINCRNDKLIKTDDEADYDNYY